MKLIKQNHCLLDLLEKINVDAKNVHFRVLSELLYILTQSSEVRVDFLIRLSIWILWSSVAF